MCLSRMIRDLLYKLKNMPDDTSNNYSMDIFSFPPDLTFSKGMHRGLCNVFSVRGKIKFERVMFLLVCPRSTLCGAIFIHF